MLLAAQTHKHTPDVAEARVPNVWNSPNNPCLKGQCSKTIPLFTTHIYFYHSTIPPNVQIIQINYWVSTSTVPHSMVALFSFPVVSVEVLKPLM